MPTFRNKNILLWHTLTNEKKKQVVPEFTNKISCRVRFHEQNILSCQHSRAK